MHDLTRIGLYLFGTVCGVGIGVGLASALGKWARPAITVCRCRRCERSGESRHVDAVGLHYADDGAVDLIALCGRHKARELWEIEEREPAAGRLRWRWPGRINGFESGERRAEG